MNELDIPVPTGYDIYWEKWTDAYQFNGIPKNNNFEPDPYDDDVVTYEQDGEVSFNQFEKPIKTILTPFGILPLTEQSLASTYFKFWVGHTNFKINSDIVNLISKCDGVEALNILSPYRFRIAVGKMFKDRDVMHQIRQRLLGYIKNGNKK